LRQFNDPGGIIQFFHLGQGAVIHDLLAYAEVLSAKSGQLRKVGDAHHLMVDTQMPEFLADNKADPAADALINLIENAIASIRTTGEIAITAVHHAEEKTVTLVVADTGAGIPEAAKSRIFEPDFTTKKSGMGLGLAIVSTIISDHNGRITVEDNIPRGAKFVIELPV